MSQLDRSPKTKARQETVSPHERMESRTGTADRERADQAIFRRSSTEQLAHPALIRTLDRLAGRRAETVRSVLADPADAERRDRLAAIDVIVEAAATVALRLAGERPMEAGLVVPVAAALLASVDDRRRGFASCLTDHRTRRMIESGVALLRSDPRLATQPTDSLADAIRALAQLQQAQPLDVVPELVCAVFAGAAGWHGPLDQRLRVVIRWTEQTLAGVRASTQSSDPASVLQRVDATLHAVIASPGWATIACAPSDRGVAEAVSAVTKALEERARGRLAPSAIDRLFTVAIRSVGHNRDFLTRIPGGPNAIGAALGELLAAFVSTDPADGVWALMHHDTLTEVVERCLGALAGAQIDADAIVETRRFARGVVQAAHDREPLDLTTIGEQMVDALP